MKVGRDQYVEGPDIALLFSHATFIPHLYNIDASSLHTTRARPTVRGMAERKKPPKRSPKKPPDSARASRLQELLEDQGWEVAHLSRTIDADPSRVYGWLKGETISSENLDALAAALSTSRRYIMTGEGPAHDPAAPAALLAAARRLEEVTKQLE